MKKAWCWLVTGVLFLSTVTAYADNNPRIITLDGHMKLSTGTQFTSVDWPVSNQWGGPQYTWVMDYDSDGYKDIVSAFNGWTLVTKRNVNGPAFPERRGTTSAGGTPHRTPGHWTIPDIAF